MFPGASPTPQLSKKERQLCRVYKGLNETDQASLLAFAEFLSQRESGDEEEQSAPQLLEPKPIEPVENESVVKGIKRLKASYFMIESDDLLHQVSTLMSEHVMQGAAAEDVIPKIETVFERFYEEYKTELIKDEHGKS